MLKIVSASVVVLAVVAGPTHAALNPNIEAAKNKSEALRDCQHPVTVADQELKHWFE